MSVRSITPNDPANFTPTLGDYKDLQPFRFWCQKVLPLVYDDSLSYYELLCKTIDYLNKTMEDVGTLEGDVTNLHKAYEQLQDYVNNYFNTLDVQEEINNKLDAMAKDGTLTNLIKTYIDPLINEQNKKIGVLEERMNTFTQLPSGSTTADAELIDIRVPASGFNNGKAYPTAGDAVRGQIGTLNKDLEDVANETYPLKWIANKTIDSQGNIINANENNVATDYIEIPDYTYTIIFNSDSDLYSSCFYDENKSLIMRIIIKKGMSVIFKPTNAKYLALTRNVAQTLTMKTFEYSNSKELKIVNDKNGMRPLIANNEPYNPNPNQEGLPAPIGVLGDNSILFDVSNFIGQNITLENGSFGWILQFKDTPNPTNFNGYKINANKQNTYSIVIKKDTKYLTVNTFGKNYNSVIITLENYVNGNQLKKYIQSYGDPLIYSAIGDSITEGSGASSFVNTFYWKLQTKLIANGDITNSYNFGSGGSSSNAISAFCGATSLYITESITLPEKGDVEIKPNIGIANVSGNVSYCNPCYIDGIKGDLSYKDKTYYFTRTDAGNQKIIASGTTIITNAGLKAIKSKLLTIFVGTNDNISDDDLTVNNTYQLSKLSSNGEYVVLTPYARNISDSLRHKLQNKFGQKCIDMFTYFSEQAVYDAIALGLLPNGSQSNWKALLLSDEIHPNDIGHQLICNKIYDRMNVLGYLN